MIGYSNDGWCRLQEQDRHYTNTPLSKQYLPWWDRHLKLSQNWWQLGNRATEGEDIPGWPGRYTSGSRSDKRQESRTSCKQRSLCQRLITSCAPAYAGAPGGSSLRATQCSTISTTSGILRQFQMPVSPKLYKRHRIYKIEYSALTPSYQSDPPPCKPGAIFPAL